MIARLSAAMGAALVCNNFQPIPSKSLNFIANEKKAVVTAQGQYLQRIKNLFDRWTESVLQEW